MAFLSKKLSQKLLQMKEKRRNETKYKNCSEVLKPLILQAFQHLIKPDKTYSYLAFSNVKINSVPTPSVLITLMCCPCA